MCYDPDTDTPESVSRTPQSSSSSWTTIASTSTSSAPSSATLALLPPPTPRPWIWQCHLCARHWRLGVTRRCLADGHRFCPGAPGVLQSRQIKISNARAKRTGKRMECASEFDYAGWREWGSWSRLNAMCDPEEGVVGQVEGCWDECEFPSMCRWKRREVVRKDSVIGADDGERNEEEETGRDEASEGEAEDEVACDKLAADDAEALPSATVGDEQAADADDEPDDTLRVDELPVLEGQPSRRLQISRFVEDPDEDSHKVTTGEADEQTHPSSYETFPREAAVGLDGALAADQPHQHDTEVKDADVIASPRSAAPGKARLVAAAISRAIRWSKP